MFHKEKRKQFLHSFHDRLSMKKIWKRNEEKEKKLLQGSIGGSTVTNPDLGPGNDGSWESKDENDNVTVCSENMMETDSRDRSSSLISHDSASADANSSISIFSPHPCRTTAAAATTSPTAPPPCQTKRSSLFPQFLSQNFFHSKEKSSRQLLMYRKNLV